MHRRRCPAERTTAMRQKQVSAFEVSASSFSLVNIFTCWVCLFVCLLFVCLSFYQLVFLFVCMRSRCEPSRSASSFCLVSICSWMLKVFLLLFVSLFLCKLWQKSFSHCFTWKQGTSCIVALSYLKFTQWQVTSTHIELHTYTLSVSLSSIEVMHGEILHCICFGDNIHLYICFPCQ